MTSARLASGPNNECIAADSIASGGMPALEAAGPAAPPWPVFAEDLSLLVRGGVHRRHILNDGDVYLRH